MNGKFITRRSKMLIGGFCLLWLVSGCGAAGGTQQQNAGGVLTPGEADLLHGTIDPADSQASSPLPGNVTAERIDSQFVSAMNDFALKLHKQAVQKTGGDNLFISPLSISLALGMALNGADGETKAEMLQALGMADYPEEKLNDSFALLQGLLVTRQQGKVDFQTANSLWLRNDLPAADSYKNALWNYFAAETHKVDFTKPDTATAMNLWVKQHTKGTIDRIADDQSLSGMMAVLVNATYFKGEWTSPFSEASTKEADFKQDDGSTVQVPMMSKEGQMAYLHEKGVQAVRLPYGNGEFAMLVMLPDEQMTLEQLHELLWNDPGTWLAEFPKKRGLLDLPRFKLEYDTELIPHLQTLGMKAAFDDTQADFSRMTHSANGLHIGQVLHKTFLEVNERGTEASAATVVAMPTSAPPPPEFHMTVDHPFFFAIEDRRTKSLLFVGSIQKL